MVGFREPHRNFRPALEGLSRYIATVETAKHRCFVFLVESILPDNSLVALNAERAAEERQGKIRWLRPEYQCPAGTATQTESVAAAAVAAVEAQIPTKRAWPSSLAQQAQSVRGALDAFNGPATAEQVARSFKSARTERVAELLDTLASLGQCRALDDGRYVA